MQEFVGPYVPHIGGDGHPNGSVFLCVTRNPPGGDTPPVLEIWRYDPGATRLVQIETLKFSGPAGYGTAIVRPDGSLFVAASAGLQHADHVGGNWKTIPGVAQPWKVEGAVVLLPPSAPVTQSIDAQARATASQALTQANAAVDVAKKAQAAADKATSAISGLQGRIPSAESIGATAWQKAVDFAASPEFRKAVAAIALQGLLDAIVYANTHTAKQSQLRNLIETVSRAVRPA